MAQRLQAIFLDTDIMLDYLEKRHDEVRGVISKLLYFSRAGRIKLVTSVFNIAELIDKEFEIHFNGWCLRRGMSSDEIFSKRKNGKFFKNISEKNKKKIKKKVENFVLSNEIEILSLSERTEDYEELYALIYKFQLRSQDALIVATALKWKVTYFLSNDSDLVRKTVEVLDVYRLRDKSHRDDFRNNVLEAIS